MKRYLALSLCAVLSSYGTTVSYSPPVGGMTISVPAGQTRSISLPLLHENTGAGKMRGRIAAIGTNYIDVTDANWTPGALSNSANPYYLRFLSGSAAGRMVLVTSAANTATRVYLNNDGVDLLGAGGPAVTDTVELVLVDTLSSLFGSLPMNGGTDYLSADNVQVWSGADWLVFYYNTDRSRWELRTDTAGSPSRNNFVLRPDRGVMVARRGATELKFRVTGRVPTVAPRLFHARPGVTFLNNGLPVSITLGDLNLNTRASDWISASDGSASLSSADLIQVWSGADWFVFYYNSTRSRWELTSDTAASPSRNTYPIPAGRPMMVRRLNSTPSISEKYIPLTLPYSG